MSESTFRALLFAGAIYASLVSWNFWTHPAVSEWFEDHDQPALRVVRVVFRIYGLEGAPDGWSRIVSASVAALLAIGIFGILLALQLGFR